MSITLNGQPWRMPLVASKKLAKHVCVCVCVCLCVGVSDNFLFVFYLGYYIVLVLI